MLILKKTSWFLIYCSVRCSGYSTSETLDAKFLTQTAPYGSAIIAS